MRGPVCCSMGTAWTEVDIGRDDDDDDKEV